MSVPTQRTERNAHSQRPIYDMALPFDPNSLRQSAERQGMTPGQSAVFAHNVLREIRRLHQEGGGPITSARIAEALRQRASASTTNEDRAAWRARELAADSIRAGQHANDQEIATTLERGFDPLGRF